MYDWLAEVSRHVNGTGADQESAVVGLLVDDANYLSHFVDVGTAAGKWASGSEPRVFTDEELCSRNFFRPSPSLRVKASGEVFAW